MTLPPGRFFYEFANGGLTRADNLLLFLISATGVHLRVSVEIGFTDQPFGERFDAGHVGRPFVLIVGWMGRAINVADGLE